MRTSKFEIVFNDKMPLTELHSVIALHCSGSSRAQWGPLEEQLDSQFKIVAPDQWGCGETEPWPGYEAFSLAAEAKPILQNIDRSPTPVHLVGHSYGGGLALHIAHQRPQCLLSLTLIEPSSFHLLRMGDENDQQLFSEIHDIAQAVNEAALSGDTMGGIASFIDYWNGAGSWDALSGKGQYRMSSCLAKTVLDFRALFIEETKLHAFASLTMPTLLIQGENSPEPSRRIVEMLASTIPFCETEIVVNAGHMSPFTHVNQVNRLIAQHLNLHSREYWTPIEKRGVA
jgi:pimeloyl-ACP methyl ester carboxylesterase